MSNIKNYAVVIRSEVLESLWILAENEQCARDYARFVDRTNPKFQFIDRAITEVVVVSEHPVLKPQFNERNDNA